ncbi:hypothetical protein IHE44_0000534 [Lamprotornis superbus]|uniref:Protein transport protein Sec61 subunit gamma n=1 Tax=Lamprotornis superbus TaxID=245042 RepID=A0A835NIG7_9PASS|nr:hypothetical protein IHE44_0000534 [Lamprotornis superbus]
MLNAIMDQVMQFVEPSRQFVKDSIRLVKRCTKPDRKEFQKIAMATAIGFAIMGFIGFFVKLIHIPINNIIVEECLSRAVTSFLPGVRGRKDFSINHTAPCQALPRPDCTICVASGKAALELAYLMEKAVLLNAYDAKGEEGDNSGKGKVG